MLTYPFALEISCFCKHPVGTLSAKSSLRNIHVDVSAIGLVWPYNSDERVLHTVVLRLGDVRFLPSKASNTPRNVLLLDFTYRAGVGERCKKLKR